MNKPIFPTLKVGDKVKVQQLNPRRDFYYDRTVTKVGRKWIELDNRSADQFDIQTGYVNGRGYMSYERIVTDEIIAYEMALSNAWKRLRSVQPNISLGYSSDKYTVDQLNRIADILEES